MSKKIIIVCFAALVGAVLAPLIVWLTAAGGTVAGVDFLLGESGLAVTAVAALGGGAASALYASRLEIK